MAKSLLFSPALATYAPGRRNMSIRHNQVIDTVARRKDVRFIGTRNFRVSGTTAVAGTPDVPVSRLTILMDKRTKVFVSMKMSGANGAYEFSPVHYGPWAVIALDHTGEYNAVIADNIYGTPM